MKLKGLVLLLFLIAFVEHSHARPVYLAAAASMTDTLQEIITEFKRSHPKAEIFPNFASSGALARQVEQGAPIDIYVSANRKWLEYLVKKGMLSNETLRVLGHNRLVFVGSDNPDVVELQDLLQLDRIGIGTPTSVPAGEYAKEALEKVGLYSTLKAEKKLVMAKDVRQALLYADRKEVDGSFVYNTDAKLARHARVMFVIPDSYHEKISYAAGLTTSGRGNEMVKLFHEFLTSDVARKIMSKHGFEPAEMTQ